MLRNNRMHAGIVVGMFLIFASGCGAGSQKVLVTGKILLNEQPFKAEGLDQAVIQLHEQGEKLGNVYYGSFDNDGNFKVEAPPGKYKVVVMASKTPKGKDTAQISYAIPVSVIPPAYSNITKTDLTIEVPSGPTSEGHVIKLFKS